MHIGIIGQSKSGKSTLGKLLARQLKQRHGRFVAVLDRTRGDGWPADWQTTNAEHFLWFAKTHQNCLLCVDESKLSLDRHNDELFYLTTTSRHEGHQAMMMAHRLVDFAPGVRDQFGWLFIFSVDLRDLKEIALSKACPGMLDLPPLRVKPYEYSEFYHVSNPSEFSKYRLDFKSKKIYKVNL